MPGRATVTDGHCHVTVASRRPLDSELIPGNLTVAVMDPSRASRIRVGTALQVPRPAEHGLLPESARYYLNRSVAAHWHPPQ